MGVSHGLPPPVRTRTVRAALVALAERGLEASPRPSIESQLLTREGSATIVKNPPQLETVSVASSDGVHLPCVAITLARTRLHSELTTCADGCRDEVVLSQHCL